MSLFERELREAKRRAQYKADKEIRRKQEEEARFEREWNETLRRNSEKITPLLAQYKIRIEPMIRDLARAEWENNWVMDNKISYGELYSSISYSWRVGPPILRTIYRRGLLGIKFPDSERALGNTYYGVGLRIDLEGKAKWGILSKWSYGNPNQRGVFLSPQDSSVAFKEGLKQALLDGPYDHIDSWAHDGSDR